MLIIDFAVPFDTRIRDKEAEKIIKYQDLVRELRKIWKLRMEVIPVIIEALGLISHTLDDWLTLFLLGGRFCPPPLLVF